MADMLVVGAGLWGAVMAERLAAHGLQVLVVDKRDHIGGNSFSTPDPQTGIEHHRYGAHIFHTSSQTVWEYVNRFTTFTPYRHKVLTRYRGRVYPMPISLATINQFFGLDLLPANVPAFMATQTQVPNGGPALQNQENLEDRAISLVGRDLYEAFIKAYTWKQWQTDPRTLPASIITRLPVRHNYNTDYFNDPWQGMPADGYGALVSRMLDHPRITVRLNTDYFAADLPAVRHTFYTGPLDAFFKHDMGCLGWRSLRFETRVEAVADRQGTAVLNAADMDVPWTRVIEFKHFHPERESFARPVTLLATEYSLPCGPDQEPYYPVETSENRDLCAAYVARAAAVPNVTFGGRLGRYRYLDMDKTMLDALETFEHLKNAANFSTPCFGDMS